MTKYRRIAMTVASSLLLAAGSATAASDYLLEIPGVPGEAAAKDGSSSIELQSFSWGVSKVNVQDISMTRHAAVVAAGDAAAAAPAPAVGSVATASVVVDPASSATAARLAQACATGKHFDKVVLTARGTRVEMQDVSVSCPAPAAGKRSAAGIGKAHELKGHVTLIK